MLPAVDVFAKAIECLKMKLFEQLDKDKTVLSPDDILWVLTVPAIWDDSAKDFMRKAAITVSIAFIICCVFHTTPVHILEMGHVFYSYNIIITCNRHHDLIVFYKNPYYCK